jgi:hypothetical protein
MSEMTVRVAKAIEAKRRELIALPLARIYPDLARAAIEALREPTEAMIKAANATADLGGYGFGDGECVRGDPADVWKSMIDEAVRVE